MPFINGGNVNKVLGKVLY